MSVYGAFLIVAYEFSCLKGRSILLADIAYSRYVDHTAIKMGLDINLFRKEK